MKRIAVLAVAVSAVVLAACSRETSTTSTTTTSATDVATSTSGGLTTSSTTAGPVQVSVVVGENTAADRVVAIALGSSVMVTLVNPDSHDDFHLHGYDLSTGRVDAGEEASISFTADKAGTFEIESHESGEVLVVLEIA